MRGKKGTLGLALIATLALTITATLGAGASADPIAQSAGLKKCLKKAKQIQDPVKRKKAKKRCRKRFAGPTPAPLIRATLTWVDGGGNTDYNLYVFDASGAVARAASNPIPNTQFAGGAPGQTGSETFTDLIFTNPGGRNFQFGVCKQDGGNDGSTYSIDYVTADGVHHSDSHTGAGDGYAAKYVSGPPIAPNGFSPCPAP